MNDAETWAQVVIRHQRAFQAAQLVAAAIAATLELMLQAANRELPRAEERWRY